MSEQTKSEENGGSVVLPLGAGVGSAWLTRRGYDSAANKLAKDAMGIINGVDDGLVKAAEQAMISVKTLSGNYCDAKKLATPEYLKGIQQIIVNPLFRDGKKLFDVKFYSGDLGRLNLIIDADKLPGVAAGLLKDGKTPLTLMGENMAEFTQGGENSWVAKTAAEAEHNLLKAVRASEVYKKAGGGMRGVFSHMEGTGKAGVVIGTVVAAAGLIIGVKNMFSRSHTSRVEAERVNTSASEKGIA